MIDSNITQQLAIKYQIDNFTIIREYLQLLFLKHFYQNQNANSVYFKGGTAIHFIYKSFRFSEDLDFTSTITKQKTHNLVQTSFNSFSKETISVTLDEQKTKYGLKYRIKYAPLKSSQILPIRLDFSFRETPLQTEITSIETDFPVLPYPLVAHLDAEELLAEKIRALLVRSQPRDLFDVWFLLGKEVKLKTGLVGKKLIIYPNIKVANLKKEITNNIKKVSEYQLKQDLNQFLPRNYRNFYEKLPELLIQQLNKQHL